MTEAEQPKEEFKHLDETCGHHCGARESAPGSLQVRHCDCSECHGEFDKRDYEIVDEF